MGRGRNSQRKVFHVPGHFPNPPLTARVGLAWSPESEVSLSSCTPGTGSHALWQEPGGSHCSKHLSLAVNYYLGLIAKRLSNFFFLWDGSPISRKKHLIFLSIAETQLIFVSEWLNLKRQTQGNVPMLVCSKVCSHLVLAFPGARSLISFKNMPAVGLNAWFCSIGTGW